VDIRLRAVGSGEYDTFVQVARAEYAADIAANSGRAPEEARAKAEADIRALLPWRTGRAPHLPLRHRDRRGVPRPWRGPGRHAGVRGRGPLARLRLGHAERLRREHARQGSVRVPRVHGNRGRDADESLARAA